MWSAAGASKPQPSSLPTAPFDTLGFSPEEEFEKFEKRKRLFCGIASIGLVTASLLDITSPRNKWDSKKCAKLEVHRACRNLLELTYCVLHLRAYLAALPTNPPECSHTVWSRNGREGCSGMLNDAKGSIKQTESGLAAGLQVCPHVCTSDTCLPLAISMSRRCLKLKAVLHVQLGRAFAR